VRELRFWLVVAVASGLAVAGLVALANRQEARMEATSCWDLRNEKREYVPARCFADFLGVQMDH